jgi:uncharacterized membrane protein
MKTKEEFFAGRAAYMRELSWRTAGILLTALFIGSVSSFPRWSGWRIFSWMPIWLAFLFFLILPLVLIHFLGRGAG